MFWRVLIVFLLVNVHGLYPTFSGDPPKPVGLFVTLKAEPPKAVYYRGDELLFRVTLANQSDHEFAVCVEDWEEPLGMLELQVTDSSGKFVNRIAGLEVFAAVDYDVLESIPSGRNLSGLAGPEGRRERVSPTLLPHFPLARPRGRYASLDSKPGANSIPRNHPTGVPAP